MDELDNWQQFLKGTQKALADLFLSYHDDLFRYGLKLTGNQELVKDCIQDLFFKLWKNRERLKKVESVKPYLLKSLRNHLIDSLEFQKPTMPITEEAVQYLEISYSHEDFMIHEQVSKESQQEVIKVLNQLTPRQREAIYLRFFENLEFENIAQIMEMNVQSVRNTIHRGMQYMREVMVLQLFMLLVSQHQR